MKYAIAFVALAGSALATEPTSTPDACAAACNQAYYKCSTAPGANHSYCGSEYAGCLGYIPFENGNTAEPTSCAVKTTLSTAAAPVPTTTPIGSGSIPVRPTNGTVPTQPTGTVPVGAAGALKPGMALLALGAIALL